MKFGVILAHAPSAGVAFPEYAAQAARTAEELGYESVWAIDHVVMPPSTFVFPFTPDGSFPVPRETAFPDPFVWLGFAAALTKRIRLCTGILILCQRHPLIVAKEAATLDVLSGGRVTLGVSLGWFPEETEALGVPRKERAPRTDEYIEALRVIWREPEPTFHGRFVRFEQATTEPKPVQRGGIPIVVAGHTAAAARRAGRLGDGFFPAVASLDELRAVIETMRATARDAGRDPDAIEVTTIQLPPYTDQTRTLDTVKQFADVGISRLITHHMDTEPEAVKRSLGDFSEKVMGRVR